MISNVLILKTTSVKWFDVRGMYFYKVEFFEF